MSDIPVGSPPVPPGRHAAASGWYPDPLDAAQERYWDGWQWSRTTRVREGAAPPPPPAWPPGAASGQTPYAGGPGNAQTGYPAQAHPGQGFAPGAPGRLPLLTADGVPVASWWWRALAALLDSLFTGVVALLLALPLFRDMFEAMSAFYSEAMAAARAGAPQPAPPELASLVSTSDQLLISVIGLSVGLLYHASFLRSWGATPGKRVCGLRVVPVDRGRFPGRLDWSTVLVRSLVWVVPAVYSALFVVTVVDVLLPLWHSKRQALHDLAARTQVVRFRR